MKNKLFFAVLVVAALFVFGGTTNVTADPGPYDVQPWYINSQPNPDLAAELHEGNTVFVVIKPAPVLEEAAIADHNTLVYGPTLTPGMVFRVQAMTEDQRWVHGWFDETSGKSWLFPADRLGTEYYNPDIPGEKDCTGHPYLSLPWFMTGGANRQIWLTGKMDKLEAYMAEDWWLLDANRFMEKDRFCLRALPRGTSVTVRAVLPDADRRIENRRAGRWAYVRLESGAEGLVPTLKLSLTPPSPAIKSTTNRTYVVQPGDSLWLIAQKFGLRLSDLIAVNKGQVTNPRMIYSGWVLNLP